MIVKVVLFGVYREKLPPQARGRTTLELPEGSPLRAVLEHFNLPLHAACAVNGQLEADRERILQEGDEVQVFRPAGGGSA
jgi:sulfur carrier protein ThiS